MNVLRILINNLFKKGFYEEKKKFNILIIFFISYKIDVKTFINKLLTNILRTLY